MPVVRAPESFTHELPHARFTALATPKRGSRETSVWRVQLSPGSPGAPHRLTREELFVVLRGSARVRIGDEESLARAGDAIIVPPETDFVLENAGDEPLEALCCLPVGGQARMAAGPAFTPPWAE